jgi:DNA repair exonuclease SbcCD ATPase subunit
MEKLIFENLVVEGFGSFEKSTTFKLDRGGQVVLVKGKNGDGKTTLFSAFIWGLFGEATKRILGSKVATWEELRTKNFKGTRVVVTFVKGGYKYIIARHFKYKGATTGIKGNDSLLLYKKLNNGEGGFKDIDLVNNDRDKSSIQAEINSILGIDYMQAKQSIFFGQRMARLIESKKEDKVKLFEELFDATWLKAAKANADVKRGELLMKSNELGVKLSALKVKLADKNQYYTSQKKILNDAEKDKECRIKSVKDEIIATKEKIGRLEKKIIELQKLSLKYDEGYVLGLQEKLTVLNSDNSLTTKSVQLDNEEKSYRELLKIKQTEFDTYCDENKKIVTEAKNNIEDTQNTYLDDIAKKKKVIRVHSEEVEKLADALKAIKRKDFGLLDEIQKCDDNILGLYEDIERVATTCPTCKQNLPSNSVEASKKNLHTLVKKEEEAKRVLEVKRYELGSKLDEAVILLKDGEDELKKLTDELAVLSESTEVQALQKAYSVLLKGYKEKVSAKEDEFSTFKELGDSLQLQRLNLDKLRRKHTQSISAIQEELRQAIEDNKNYKKAGDDVGVVKIEVKHMLENIKALNERLKVENSAKLPDINLDEILESIDVVKNDIDALQPEFDNFEAELDDVKWWSAVGFGVKGIKSYIFTAGLLRLNKFIERYAQRLGYRVRFNIDHSTANKDFYTTVFYTKHTEEGLVEFEKDYEEFSGGQQQRIALAIAFAMFDIVSSKINCNLLIMDEAFEGLDAEGRETAFDLIRLKMQEGKTVFIITHSDEIDSKYSKSISIYRENNLSKIEDFC